jgi:hypothetical protein
VASVVDCITLGQGWGRRWGTFSSNNSSNAAEKRDVRSEGFGEQRVMGPHSNSSRDGLWGWWKGAGRLSALCMCVSVFVAPLAVMGKVLYAAGHGYAAGRGFAREWKGGRLHRCIGRYTATGEYRKVVLGWKGQEGSMPLSCMCTSV